MSALARYYIGSGAIVSGSDQADSDILKGLEMEGATITIGHDGVNLPNDVNTVVYTLAVQEDNAELLKAKELAVGGVKILTYAEALGEMSKSKRTIAVCGTHGKTTTTAMAYYALTAAGVDASMIVGSLIEHEGRMTNYIHGSSDWLVIEACEYMKSFLNYNPEIIIVTNIDADHLDYYKDLNDIKNSFQQFVDRLPSGGMLLCHESEFVYLNTNNKVLADVYASSDIDLSVPGEHNRSNAQLVVALGNVLKLNNEKVREGLKSFKGTWRRQEYKGVHWGMECYDDYAHHPSEIAATLQAFRELVKAKSVVEVASENKIIAVFMPHLYSRTKLLLKEFGACFQDADEVILLPIYAAREAKDENISSEILAEEIKSHGKSVIVIESIDKFKTYISDRENSNSMLITMGAGDIYKVYE